jgi:hypothetical protein
MRRRPDLAHPSRAAVRPLGPPSPRQPQQQGDAVDAFLASGGQTRFQVQDPGPPVFDPRSDGVQLITSLYVPAGRVAFVKEIRVAPFMPTMLTDPWTTSGSTGASWRDLLGDGTEAPGGTNGVWTTPFGWESYFNPPDFAPQWSWFLRVLRGDIDKNRKVPFTLADPATWYLAENVAVPGSVYAAGIPGTQPTGYWRPQRMQMIQGDKLNTHVLVGPDCTICLWARWLQGLYQPNAQTQTGEGIASAPYGEPLYPLLPSFGQLHGYIQAADRVASTENAEYGWGG